MSSWVWLRDCWQRLIHPLPPPERPHNPDLHALKQQQQVLKGEVWRLRDADQQRRGHADLEIRARLLQHEGQEGPGGAAE